LSTVQEWSRGGRRCKKSTLNDLVHLTPLRIPLMNPPVHCRPGRYGKERRAGQYRRAQGQVGMGGGGGVARTEPLRLDRSKYCNIKYVKYQ
jgi:hypothetical protein